MRRSFNGYNAIPRRSSWMPPPMNVLDVFAHIFAQVRIDGGFINKTIAEQTNVKSTGQRVYARIKAHEAVDMADTIEAGRMLDLFTPSPQPRWATSSATIWIQTFNNMTNWCRIYRGSSADKTSLVLDDFTSYLPSMLFAYGQWRKQAAYKSTNYTGPLVPLVSQPVVTTSAAPTVTVSTTNPCGEITVDSEGQPCVLEEKDEVERKRFYVKCLMITRVPDDDWVRYIVEDRNHNLATFKLHERNEAVIKDLVHAGDCFPILAIARKGDDGSTVLDRVRVLVVDPNNYF